ncbi:MAG: DUF4321 domain-containing protein [Clostridiales bacterium]|jgi:hypothetical protein|nr:DUF4321 domain-containing protein [Clostridiales bacterium]
MKTKNTFIFILVILTGAVVGGLIAELCRNVSFLSWLAYGSSFGVSIDNPLVLDLSVVKLKFGIIFDINIATILGIVIALLIYKKLA